MFTNSVGRKEVEAARLRYEEGSEPAQPARYTGPHQHQHTSRYLKDTDIGAIYQGKEGGGPGAREQGRGVGLGEAVLGIAAGLGAMMQDLEAGQDDIEAEGAGLNNVVEDEGARLIAMVKDQGVGLVDVVEDEGAGLIYKVEDETAAQDNTAKHVGTERDYKEQDETSEDKTEVSDSRGRDQPWLLAPGQAQGRQHDQGQDLHWGLRGR